MLRKHIRDELEHNKIKDLKQLLDDLDTECYKKLKYKWYIKTEKIPEDLKSVDDLDISRCCALIQNVFVEKTNFNYTKFKYVKQLRDIRNEEFGHMLLFETDDLISLIRLLLLETIGVRFSTTET